MRTRDPRSTYHALASVAVGAAVLIAGLGHGPAMAQGRQGAPGPPPAPPFDSAQGAPSASRGARAASPIDLTGYWVSVVTEDWRYRMVTPAKGDFQGVPMTVAARDAANRWDPARDEAEGGQCRSYGAPAIMRAPGRLHITWQDDRTLKIDTDTGTQTRLLQFDAPAADGGRSLQGSSRAEWIVPAPARGGGPAPPRGGSLKVVTSRLLAGYLRKNGVPYSENAMLTEHFDVVRQRNGDRWLVLTSVVEDPVYLQQPFITSTQFKAQADATGWEPSPCSSTW